MGIAKPTRTDHQPSRGHGASRLCPPYNSTRRPSPAIPHHPDRRPGPARAKPAAVPAAAVKARAAIPVKPALVFRAPALARPFAALGRTEPRQIAIAGVPVPPGLALFIQRRGIGRGRQHERGRDQNGERGLAHADHAASAFSYTPGPGACRAP